VVLLSRRRKLVTGRGAPEPGWNDAVLLPRRPAVLLPRRPAVLQARRILVAGVVLMPRRPAVLLSWRPFARMSRGGAPVVLCRRSGERVSHRREDHERAERRGGHTSRNDRPSPTQPRQRYLLAGDSTLRCLGLQVANQGPNPPRSAATSRLRGFSSAACSSARLRSEPPDTSARSYHRAQSLAFRANPSTKSARAEP
jgi:hypothetical protein